MNSHRFRGPVRLAFLLVFALGMSVQANARFKWAPVTSADRAAVPSIPDAGMEILFSRHTMDEHGGITFSDNYVRAKVYNQRGIENISILSIEHGSNSEIRDLVARVTKPDGSAVELKKDDFHETTLLRRGDDELKKTTFAFPGLQAGDVVEYRWIQDIPPSLWSYYRFFCQAEEIFTREYSFEVKKSSEDYDVIYANCGAAQLDSKKRKVVVRNLAPFVREPNMPPETEFRGWIMIIFTHPLMRLYGVGVTWTDLGNDIATTFDESCASEKTVDRKTAELMADRGTPEEALGKIYRFTQTQIKNLDWDDSPSLAEARKTRTKSGDQTPAQTLARGTGTATDVDLLFAAMARAAGFDVRVSLNGSRDEVLDIHTPKGWVMANRRTILVNLEGEWKYYEPGNLFAPFGMLDLKDEGAMTYICDQSRYWWTHSPVAKPEETRVDRTGHLSLRKDGTLDGTIEIRSTGHRAMEARAKYYHKTSDAAKALLLEELNERLPNAEATNVTWTNLDDNSLPLVLSYKIHVPGYAESLGTRLLFQLNYFTANIPAMFPQETRHYPVFLKNAEEFHDELDLILPEGFELDGPSVPAQVGAADQIINSRYSGKYFRKSRKLEYHRDFVLGNEGVTMFKAESYPLLRQILDRVHRADTQQIALKVKSAGNPTDESSDEDPESGSTP